MVKEAQKQVIQTVHRAVACVGRSVALTGDRLHFLESGAHGATGLQVMGRAPSCGQPSSQGAAAFPVKGPRSRRNVYFSELLIPY